MKLSRVVVIFDECDELFRERSPQKDSEQTRGITAFITACMLPKLQELHDRGKVVFFICTNNFGSIDSAIKRGGRIDHIIGVGSPDKMARKKIIESEINKMRSKESFKEPDNLIFAIEKLSEESNRFIRSEVIRALHSLMDNYSSGNEAEINKQVQNIIASYEDSLTITKNDSSKFEDDNKKYNHIIIEGDKI